jgi:diacylglycerol kinase (ATP)
LGGREGGAPPLVIANPVARRGRARRDLGSMLEALRAALGPLDCRVTERPGHAEQMAAAAAGERRPLVICLGGNGTPNEVVNGLLGEAAGAPPRLGIVSTGSGGDFGRSLGLAHRFDAYLAALTSGRERPIDVGRARFTGADGTTCERLWVNVLSAGIGGLVDIYSAAAPSWLGGRIAYGAAALTGIVTCPRVTLRCRSVLPDGSPDARFLRAHAVAVCNGHTFGGGMKIAPTARVDDGLLEIVSFETTTKLQLIRRFGTVYRGTHVLEPGVNHFTCRSLELTPVEADGRPLAPQAPPNRPSAPPSRPPDTSMRAPSRRSLKHGLFPLDIDGDHRGDVPVSIDLLPGELSVLA